MISRIEYRLSNETKLSSARTGIIRYSIFVLLFLALVSHTKAVQPVDQIPDRHSSILSSILQLRFQEADSLLQYLLAEDSRNAEYLYLQNYLEFLDKFNAFKPAFLIFLQVEFQIIG